MEPFVRHFIRSSLLWLGIGVLLGLYMVVVPAAIAYRPAHMHANLLGFVSMMIFGVAYHVLPRFLGQPLHSRRIAAVHVWISNAGLAALVAGWLLRPHVSFWSPILLAGALLSATGAFAFIFNLWRTLDAGSAQARARLATLRPPSVSPP